MEVNQTQELEIEALKAIYGDDFQDAPASQVWKGAAKFPEFAIRVRPNDSDLYERVGFTLHVKFSKTYPRVMPTLTVESPNGISKAHVSQLQTLLKAEAQKALGREMVFELVTFCQEWITHNNVQDKNSDMTPSTSLATEMVNRASTQQQEQERQLHEAQLRQKQLEAEQAAAIARQIDEKKEEKRRLRVLDTPDTEFFQDGMALSNVFAFNEEITSRGYLFHSVVLSSPIPEGAGTVMRADPQCEARRGPIRVPVLEVYRVSFDHPHYKNPYGYRKVADIYREIEALKAIDNANILKIHAAQLDEMLGAPRLTVLLDQRTGPSLRDVLLHSDGLNIDRALDYFGQLLFGLGSLHAHNICHRYLTAECITLSPMLQNPHKSLLKIGRCAYYARILELHRSNHIVEELPEMWHCPESWLPMEALEKPLEYSSSRDIWSLGIVLLQMLRGLAVTSQYSDPQAALHDNSEAFSQGLYNLLSGIFIQNRKKSPSCTTLTGQLSQMTGSMIASSSIPVPTPLRTPLPARDPRHSPEIGFFAPRSQSVTQTRSSRYQEDWEELEFLGRGGFGSVVKARNKLDGRICAIKKVKLRGTENDDKIFREVNALSRLNHRYIVRYYATWLETVHRKGRNGRKSPGSWDSAEDDEDEDEDTTDSDTTASRKKPRTAKPFDDENMLGYDLDDLTLHSKSRSGRSFPSIHFGEETSTRSLAAEDDDEDEGSETEEELVRSPVVRPRPVPRILYIQMEFVDQQTLRERIMDEGLSEEQAWTLFRQVLDAVVHISSLGITHRDLKPSNIFLTASSDCKIGDFGLATSSLAAVDPSDVDGGHGIVSNAEMTSGVGTSLYVAPEVLNGKAKSHSKADMYSLGIVFFEMNYKFNTGAERVAVIQQLRLPEVVFPADFNRSTQKEVIRWLLQHDPADRPSAVELFQSSMLPQQMEDAYFREASRLMTNPESRHYGNLVAALFNNPVNQIRDVLYDEEERPEHSALDGVVEDRLIACFQLHGAVNMEPLLLMPAKAADLNDSRSSTFLDRQGELVTLPKQLVPSFARLAARMGIERIKRFYIGNTYRTPPTGGGGHPKILKAAIFDIITSDPTVGVSEAETIALVNEIVDIFPGLNASAYEINISHTKVCDAALLKLPDDQRRNVRSILSNAKTSIALKKSLLTKLGLARATVEDLEALLPTDEVDTAIARLSKTSYGSSLAQPFTELRTVVHFAKILGVTRRINLKPWIPSESFGSGIVFEISKGLKRSDVIASGGRYDQLLVNYWPPTAAPPAAPLRSTAVQIAVDKITAALAAHQRASIKHLIKDKRTFGLWSPRRCDVYICDHQSGHLSQRLETAATLWQNGISADMMYDAAVEELEEVTIAKCQNEGILFLVYYRGTGGGRPTFRVKSVLRGTEQEVMKHDLVSSLQSLIAEQRRFDKEHENPSAPLKAKDITDVPIILSPDNATRKHRHNTKTLYQSRANAVVADVREAIEGPDHSTIGVDLHPAAWNAITASQAWITSDSVWRTLLDETPDLQKEVGTQLREHINGKRAAGQKLVFLFSLRDEKLHLYHLQ